MSAKFFRKSKAKLQNFNKYVLAMNDYVSSSEEEYLATEYEPEVRLDDVGDGEEANWDNILKEQLDDEEILACLDEVQSGNSLMGSQRGTQDMKKLDIPDYSGQKIQKNQYTQSSQNHKIQKKEYPSPHKSSQSCPEPQKKEDQCKNQGQTSSQTRKKNIFLSKQQKQKLEYDIKSQRFLLPELIQKYGISRSTIKRYLAEINRYGQILMPKEKTRVVSGSKQNKITKFIKESIEKNPFLSQKQMALMIREEMHIDVSQQTVSLILKKSNITKKKGMITYKEGNSEQNMEKRYEYAKLYQILNEQRVIFMDETGFNECIEVQYGYAPRGKRLLKQKSGKKGHKIVVILSMTFDRICHWDIVNLSVKTQHVASYIKKFSKEFRGYSLIMDNARVHKTQEVAEAVGSMGLNPIFLPPYSPQLNPIELVFGRLKTIYKSRSGIKLQQPQTELSQKVDLCLKSLAESKLDNYRRPVNFWIGQALKRKKFSEVVQQRA